MAARTDPGRRKGNMTTAETINILGNFCGKRDLETLTPACLEETFGMSQADVMVLFGGSILCGGDLLAEAMKCRIARHYIIVGGAGHTTPVLRAKMHQLYPGMQTADLSEAEIFNAYLRSRHNMQADYLETTSTNCGSNITHLLQLLAKEHIRCRHIILVQDAAMQYRMELGMRRYAPDMHIMNYAAYRAVVREEGSALAYAAPIWGMWDIERYISLLLGEIPRLKDDENGYGPAGRGFIAHADIPAEVEQAFSSLRTVYPALIRPADPAFATDRAHTLST